jgi:nucleoside-diphosphate-sugar epimerase
VRVLVIGGGFIATSIVDRLLQDGHIVVVFTRKFNKMINCKQQTGDIFDFDDFITQFDFETDVVVLTAWVTNINTYKNDQANYDYAKFTKKLAQFLSKTNVSRLIVLGSRAEYGRQIQPSVAGVTLLNPENLYAQQKVLAHKFALEAIGESKLKLVWARVFQPYGPRQDIKRLIPYLVESLRNRSQIQLNDVSSINDWITTRDIASAISWTITRSELCEIDLGSSTGHTNLELLKTLENLMGVKANLSDLADISSQPSEVAVVGKNSPLFVSGWRANDDLLSGLSWVLSS